MGNKSIGFGTICGGESWLVSRIVDELLSFWDDNGVCDTFKVEDSSASRVGEGICVGDGGGGGCGGIDIGGSAVTDDIDGACMVSSKSMSDLLHKLSKLKCAFILAGGCIVVMVGVEPSNDNNKFISDR